VYTIPYTSGKTGFDSLPVDGSKLKICMKQKPIDLDKKLPYPWCKFFDSGIFNYNASVVVG
jgi:hypothetical protein